MFGSLACILKALARALYMACDRHLRNMLNAATSHCKMTEVFDSDSQCQLTAAFGC